MSKSLGNVLDPFEVMDTFGTDALRYYCFREVSFGQDGGVSTTTFGERYETELANEYGNLASRTLAMIAPLPRRRGARRRRRPGAGRRLRRPRRRGLRAARPRRDHAGARAHLAARAAAQPLRRGARAVAARQGRGEAPASSTSTLRSLAEGLRVGDRAAAPVHARDARRSCSRALGRGRARARRRAGFGARPGGGARRARSPPLFPKPQ